MRNLIIGFSTAILFLFCLSCGKVYVKHQELSPGLQWQKKDVREFKVPVKDIAPAYNMSISFRYVYGYQYQVAKIKVTEINPGGKQTVKEYDLKVREENGDYIGEAGLDIWDSYHLVGKNVKYQEPGTYTYIIEHNMPVDPLTDVMEIGIILEKAK